MDKSTISVTLRGDGLKKKKWIEWYGYICFLFDDLGYPRTHLAITSEKFNSGKIVTVNRSEKKILQMLEDGLLPVGLDLFSLPKDYKSASFDYDVCATRGKDFISVIFNSCDFNRMDVQSLVFNMKQYIEFDNGEIYRMDRNEMPLIYAAQANSLDAYKSLEVMSIL